MHPQISNDKMKIHTLIGAKDLMQQRSIEQFLCRNFGSPLSFKTLRINKSSGSSLSSNELVQFLFGWA